jgi:hypothetical protein
MAKDFRFPQQMGLFAIAIVVLAVLVGIVASWAYALVLVLVGLIVGGAITAVHQGNARRGRDGSRSADAEFPHQGLDDATPLGDTDQHSGPRSTGEAARRG